MPDLILKAPRFLDYFFRITFLYQVYTLLDVSSSHVGGGGGGAQMNGAYLQYLLYINYIIVTNVELVNNSFVCNTASCFCGVVTAYIVERLG